MFRDDSFAKSNTIRSQIDLYMIGRYKKLSQCPNGRLTLWFPYVSVTKPLDRVDL